MSSETGRYDWEFNTITGDATIDRWGKCIFIDCSTININVTLPYTKASQPIGVEDLQTNGTCRIIKIDNTIFTGIITGFNNGTVQNTIDGSLSDIILANQYDYVEFYNNNLLDIIIVSQGSLTASEIASLTLTKGALITSDGTTAVTLPIGTNNQILTADNSQTSGMQWETLTNNISSTTNTMTSDVNGVSSSASIINTNSMASSANLLTSTINSIASTPVDIINTNALSLTGNLLESTINGINSNTVSVQTLISSPINGDIVTTNTIGQSIDSGILFTNVVNSSSTAVQSPTALATWTAIENAVTNVLIIQGTWDASTNTPLLSAGIGTNGFAYYVSVAGTQTLPSGTLTVYSVGDLIFYSSAASAWDKFAGGNTVISVNGMTGIVSLGIVNMNDTSISTPTDAQVLIYNNMTNKWNNVTLSGAFTITDTGIATLSVVPITLGGTGQITANNALNALLPSQTGNAGFVLNTNGTNAIWEAPTSQFDATVGVGGSYATVNLALVAGNTSIVIVGATAETSDIILNTSIYIYVKLNVVWNMSDFQIQLNTSNLTLFMTVDGMIAWAPTMPKNFIDGLTNGGTFIRGNFIIDGSGGTADDCPLYGNLTSATATGVTQIRLPNQNGWGIHLDTTAIAFEVGAIAFLNLATSGTNIYNLLSYTTGIVKNVGQIVIGGTMNAVNPLINSMGGIQQITMLPISAPQTLQLNIGGTLNELVGASGYTFNITISANNASINNCQLYTGNIDINGFANVILSNISCNNILNINSTTVLDIVKRITDTLPIIDHVTFGNNLITNANLTQAILNTWVGNNTGSTANKSDNVIGNITETGSSIFTISGTNSVLNNATIKANLPSADIYVGNASNVPVGVTLSGDGTISNIGVLTITTATNMRGGAAGEVPYQSASGTTAFSSVGTAGQVLSSNGTGAPSWITLGSGTITLPNADILVGNVSNVATAVAMSGDATLINTGAITVTTSTNLRGGNPGRILYQSATGTTNFVAVGATNQLLIAQGTNAPIWTTTLPTVAMPALTGDVTNTAGSLTTTISNNVVTNAKLAQAPALTLKGNNTGSTANESDLTVAQITTMIASTVPTANTIAEYDANKNLTINNVIVNFTSTVTAGGTTTLTITSSQIQVFTGGTTQTVVLPNATTLVNATSYMIINQSIGIVTINTNGGALLTTIPAGNILQVILTNNTIVAGVWALFSNTISNALSSSTNTMTSNVNGVSSNATIINSHTMSSSVNSLTSTINGITSSAVNLINTNALSSSTNTMTSTVNGIASNASIINTNVLGLSGVSLTETINGVISNTVSVQPLISSPTTNDIVTTSSTGQVQDSGKSFTTVVNSSSTDAQIPTALATYTAITGATTGAISGSGTSGQVAQFNGTNSIIGVTENTAFNRNFETSTANILMNGTVSVGTSNNTVRSDHVHPTDTTRAGLANNNTYTGMNTFTTTTTVPTPINLTDAANKSYVDQNIASIKQFGTDYTTTANLNAVYLNGTSGAGATLTGVAFGAFATDGFIPGLGSIILVKNQTTTFQNGRYSVTATGGVSSVYVLTRTTDYNQTGEIQSGDIIFVANYTVNTAPSWVETAVVNTIGTDPIVFVLFNLAPGALLASNNLSDVANAAISLSNLNGVPKTTTVNSHALNSNVIISASDITTGTLPAAQLPNPTATTLGGIESLAAVTSKWINTISTSGVPSATQPAFTDVSGSITISQITDNTITNAKLIQSTANTWKGNNTGSTANESANSTAALTETTSAVLTITGGANALLNATSIQVKQSNTSTSGYLSSTDWNTFNNKLTSTLSSTNIFVGNGSNIATAVAMSGDATLSNIGAITVTTATNLRNGTVGQVPYQSASSTTGFTTSGTTGQVLTYQSGSAPIWTTVSSGSGTVTSVSVVSVNGLAGTVATATTTPAITLSTTVTGLLKGNGTAISAATAGTDYQAALTNPVTSSTSSGSPNQLAVFNGTGDQVTPTTTLPTAAIPALTGDVTGTTGSTSIIVTTSTNIRGGAAGEVPYQSASGTTAFSAVGTIGQVLTSAGTGTPIWTTVASGGLSTFSNTGLTTSTEIIIAMAPLLNGIGYYTLTIANGTANQLNIAYTLLMNGNNASAITLQVEALNDSAGIITYPTLYQYLKFTVHQRTSTPHPYILVTATMYNTLLYSSSSLIFSASQNGQSALSDDTTITQYICQPIGNLTGTYNYNTSAGVSPSYLTATTYPSVIKLASNIYASGGTVVNMFGINVVNGQLSALSPATVPAGSNGFGIVSIGIGANYYTYVANGNSNNISMYLYNPANGQLSALSPATIACGNSPKYIATITIGSNSYLYITNQSDNTVSMYSIASTGLLTPLSTPTVGTGTNPSFIIAVTLGTNYYVYVYNTVTWNTYTINILTGILTGTVTTGGGTQAAGIPSQLTIGTNYYIYTPGGGGGVNSIYMYSINASTGVWSFLSPVSVTTPNPICMTIIKIGANYYGYAANGSSAGTISQFSINSSTGVWSPLSPATVATINNTPGSITAIAVTSSSAYLYACDQGGSGNIAMFSIDQITGKLTALSTPNITPTTALVGLCSI